MAKSYRFSGGTSFMSNGYVIWKNGIPPDEPNFLGVKQGETYVERMMYTRSLDQRSSFYEFVEFLSKIQQKEADKERKYIELKLRSMQLNKIDPDRYHAVWNAINNDQFGLAYTLLTERAQSIKELKEELKKNHFNNISHMNSFWDKQFSKFFEKKFAEIAKIKEEKLLSGFFDSNLSIDSLVDEWIAELMSGSNGVIIESLTPMRKKMKKELSDYFIKAGFSQAEDYSADLFGNNQDLTSLTKNKTVYTNKTKNSTSTKKRSRKPATLVREIAATIGNVVGRGIAQEFAATALQGKDGNSISINTGEFKKEIHKELSDQYGRVNQKVDVTSIEIFNSEINLQGIAKEIFSEYGDDLQAGLNALINKLESTAKEGEEIFQVLTNVKGYRSKRDLIIAKEENFKQRTQNLAKMAEEAEGIPAFSMEKLIFLLNNTVDGCIAANEIAGLTSYIAAVCSAWLWDDYTSLFSLSEGDSKITKIRMFHSGGFYYSASQIISQALDELLLKGQGSSFVVVDIKPPSFDEETMYAGLRDRYPVPTSLNKQEWQNALKPRWDEMKNYVEREGRVSIKFSQKGIEDIIGKLEQYL